MWDVKIVQKEVDRVYGEVINAEFEALGDAQCFADLALKGVKNATVTLTWVGTNIKVEGEE